MEEDNGGKNKKKKIVYFRTTGGKLFTFFPFTLDFCFATEKKEKRAPRVDLTKAD